ARSSSTDTERANIVRALRRAYPERKIVAFSQYADTVDGMFARIHSDGEAAALTGSGALVSGGSISRREVLERFAPRAHRAAVPRSAERIGLLLTTDLLSEGVNLQDAGIVIHFDFPWTPARVEQRLGRVARLGAVHSEVLSFAFRPPASGTAVVRIEEILKRKMKDAGIVTEAVPSLSIWSTGRDASPNPSSANEQIRNRLRSWITPHRDDLRGYTMVAQVQSSSVGFLALISDNDELSLIGSIDGRIDQSPAFVLACVAACQGKEIDVNLSSAEQALQKIHEWSTVTHAIGETRKGSQSHMNPRTRLLRRIDRIVHESHSGKRAVLAQKAELARAALMGHIDAQGEIELSNIDATGAELIDRILGVRTRSIEASRQRPPCEARVLILFGK
ncbi:MAG TPA: helicase-related protein, partial [Gemmatimonadaceae bacterium]